MSDRPPRWMSWVLYAAGAYNVARGASVVFVPLAIILYRAWESGDDGRRAASRRPNDYAPRRDL